jgi:putative transposase
MGQRYGEKFKREAVRLALTSGLPRKQISTDLGVGFSTLNKWMQQSRDDDLLKGRQVDQEVELSRLRKENRILREEREILKRRRCIQSVIATSTINVCNGGYEMPRGLLREPKMTRFSFIDAWKKTYAICRMCKVLEVSARGNRAWRSRPMSQRQRDDMVLLAHIRDQHTRSLHSCGRLLMTEELRELGFKAGQRRVGRLMRENGIVAIRTREYKATTDSNHTLAVAPNLLDRDFSATVPNRKKKRGATSRLHRPARAGCTWLSFWICILAGSLAGPSATA